jgi:hypothetical protein
MKVTLEIFILGPFILLRIAYYRRNEDSLAARTFQLTVDSTLSKAELVNTSSISRARNLGSGCFVVSNLDDHSRPRVQIASL